MTCSVAGLENYTKDFLEGVKRYGETVKKTRSKV